MGGLGNQMLQYATGFAYAKRIGAAFFVDIEYYKIDSKLKDTHRDFELSAFNIVSDGQYSGILSFNNTRRLVLHVPLIRKVVLPLIGINYYTDSDSPDFGNKPGAKKLNYLDGFWSKFRYFDEYKNELCGQYDFSKNFRGENKVLAEAMQAGNSVAVHIRRTDYLLQDSDHIALSEEYYRKAIQLVQSHFPGALFYFFGDDHHWIKNTFPIGKQNYFLVDHNGGKNSYLDMGLMAQCRHHIISNSTFGWWGAYLNQSDGLKIAPARWLHPGRGPHFVYEDFIPGDWLKLEF